MFRKIKFNNEYIAIDFENLRLHIYNIGGGRFTFDAEAHSHGKFYYELHLICDGKGTLVTENGSYPLGEGDIFMTGPQIRHKQLTDKDDNMIEYCLGFNISRKKNKPDTPMSELLQKTYFWLGKDDGAFMQYFEKLADEFDSHNIGFTKAVGHILSLMMVDLVRSYKGKELLMAENFSISDDLRMRIIENIFLEECATITEEEMSARLNLSSRQLLRFLKKQYGKTFAEMKREARIDHAYNMIKHGSDIEEAAASAGYTDIVFFKKILKSYKIKKNNI